MFWSNLVTNPIRLSYYFAKLLKIYDRIDYLIMRFDINDKEILLDWVMNE